MSNPVFSIKIDGEVVKGEYGESDGVQPETEAVVTLDLDALTLETVGLMDRWLCFWDVIEGAKIRRMERLLEPNTLKILGKQLWRLILDNDVGTALKAKVPKAGDPPLRLSIEFHDSADRTLKGLPWEFLMEPEKGWFLATRTELLLTRHVSVSDWDPIEQIGDSSELRALLIAALPEDDAFAAESRALSRLRTALQDVPNLEVSDLIDAWRPKKIKQSLEAYKPHIVHVVGICRGDPGKPEIYLGGDFTDPDTFVECLTANTPRPLLIILQLCDYKDGDASENFERLAPQLIKNRVPAVLALQYAYRSSGADRIGLGKEFYQLLVNGEHIGAAVQQSREWLRHERVDRRFGTPVLYLQEDTALRPPGTGDDEHTSRTEMETDTIRDALFDWVFAQDLDDDELASSLLLLVADLDERAGPRTMQVQVLDRLRERRPEAERRALTGLLVELGKWELDDARS